MGVALALEMFSLLIKIRVVRILLQISEDFADLAGSLAFPAIRLFVTVPLARLATADICRWKEMGTSEASLSYRV